MPACRDRPELVSVRACAASSAAAYPYAEKLKRERPVETGLVILSLILPSGNRISELLKNQGLTPESVMRRR
jgi:hypothetical protein